MNMKTARYEWLVLNLKIINDIKNEKKKIIETIMGNKSQQTNTIHLKSQKTESYKN